MILKTLLPVLTLGYGLQASADFGKIGFAYLHCSSPTGEMSLEANSDQSSYKLGLVVNGETKLVVLEPGQFHANGNVAVSLTKFEYDDSSKNFITLDAYLTKPVWHAPHDGCMPTRAPGQCVPIHTPGSWGNSYTDDIGIALKPLGNGKFLLTNVNGEKYGIPDAMPLGEGVLCEGSVE